MAYSSYLSKYSTPKNVRVLAVVIMLLALVSFVPHFLLLVSSSFRAIYADEGLYYNVFISSATVIIAIVALIGAYGMLKLKEWGRQMIIVAAILSFFIFAANSWYAMRSNNAYTPILVPLTTYALLLYFLSREETVKLFS